jgi:hypothetical protein
VSISIWIFLTFWAAIKAWLVALGGTESAKVNSARTKLDGIPKKPPKTFAHLAIVDLQTHAAITPETICKKSRARAWGRTQARREKYRVRACIQDPRDPAAGWLWETSAPLASQRRLPPAGIH